MKRKNLFMKIKDKVAIANYFCPSHYLPNRFPFGIKISNEPCHIHKSRLRMLHHTCKKLQCPNYRKMMRFDREYGKTY